MKKVIHILLLMALLGLMLSSCGQESTENTQDPRAPHFEGERCQVDKDCINWEYGEKCIDGFCVEKEDQ